MNRDHQSSWNLRGSWRENLGHSTVNTQWHCLPDIDCIPCNGMRIMIHRESTGVSGRFWICSWPSWFSVCPLWGLRIFWWRPFDLRIVLLQVSCWAWVPVCGVDCYCCIYLFLPSVFMLSRPHRHSLQAIGDSGKLKFSSLDCIRRVNGRVHSSLKTCLATAQCYHSPAHSRLHSYIIWVRLSLSRWSRGYCAYDCHIWTYTFSFNTYVPFHITGAFVTPDWVHN